MLKAGSVNDFKIRFRISLTFDEEHVGDTAERVMTLTASFQNLLEVG